MNNTNITPDEAWELWESGVISYPYGSSEYNISQAMAMALASPKMAHKFSEDFLEDNFYDRHPSRDKAYFSDKEFAYSMMEREALEDEADSLDYSLIHGDYISELDSQDYYDNIHYYEPEEIPYWKLLTDRLTMLLGDAHSGL